MGRQACHLSLSSERIRAADGGAEAHEGGASLTAGRPAKTSTTYDGGRALRASWPRLDEQSAKERFTEEPSHRLPDRSG